MSKEQLLKKWYIPAVAVAVVFIAVLVIFLAFRGGDETYRSIRIVEMEGGVTIERDGVGSLEASVNMNLISNDYVRTDADSYVVLRLDDDKYVMLGEQGAMQVRAEGSAESGRTAIHLENGSVLSEIQNPLGQDSSYEIITPSATMSVRGTVFETRKAPEGDSFELLVYEGTVAARLGNLEPVLYTGGEYTQFASGDVPQFLVERDIITEDRMNDQMLERLQQIEENGRALDFGEVHLDELIEERSSSEGRTEVADNSQVREPTASAEAPEITASEAPTASPTASPAPTATRRPATTATPTATPTATKAPVVTTAPPADTNESEESSDDIVDSNVPEHWEPSWPTITPTSKPDNGNHGTDQENKNYQDWWNPANGEDNGSEPDDANGWKVNYYIPAIAKNLEQNNEVGNENDSLLAEICTEAPRLYKQAWSQDENKLEEIIPEENVAPGGAVPDGLTFVGWYTESGREWDFDEIPQSNLWLYAVWKDAAGNYYYPVILRDEETGYYRCYSVKEGMALFQSPVISEDSYEGYTEPQRNNYLLAAWEKTNATEEEGNALWGTRTETVSGVTALRPVWLKQTGNGSLVLFVTGTKENGYGDIVDIFYVENGKGISAPARSFSSGIEPKEVTDWLTAEEKSYEDTTVNNGMIYIFSAV